ncbi:hypothetical protein HHX47_DHR5000750 [Lentinula edodes]|nr:hypothetical protein HHX47_DHR5000750 [Lentinula edodes]
MDEFGEDIDPLNICDGFDQDSPIFSYADVDALRETRGSLNSYKKECYSGLGRIHTEIGALKTENRELEERLRDGKMHLRYLQRKVTPSLASSVSSFFTCAATNLNTGVCVTVDFSSSGQAQKQLSATPAGQKHSMTDNPRHPTKRRRSNTNKDTVLKNLTATITISAHLLRKDSAQVYTKGQKYVQILPQEMTQFVPSYAGADGFIFTVKNHLDRLFMKEDSIAQYHILVPVNVGSDDLEYFGIYRLHAMTLQEFNSQTQDIKEIIARWIIKERFLEEDESEVIGNLTKAKEVSRSEFHSESALNNQRTQNLPVVMMNFDRFDSTFASLLKKLVKADSEKTT